jgi:hypothetical protein
MIYAFSLSRTWQRDVAIRPQIHVRDIESMSAGSGHASTI